MNQNCICVTEDIKLELLVVNWVLVSLTWRLSDGDGHESIFHWPLHEQPDERLGHRYRQVPDLYDVQEALLHKGHLLLVSGLRLEQLLAVLVLLVGLKHLVLTLHLPVSQLFDNFDVLV